MGNALLKEIAKQLSGLLLFIASSPNDCSDSSFRKACFENKRGTVVHNKSDTRQPKEPNIMVLFDFSLKSTLVS